MPSDSSMGFKAIASPGSSGSSYHILSPCPKLIQKRGRTLPHFQQTDYGTVSRGYIWSSYFHGLLPHEFFFHAKAERTKTLESMESLKDTLRLRRQLARTTEDIIVHYDSTVRNSEGQVIQVSLAELHTHTHTHHTQ